MLAQIRADVVQTRQEMGQRAEIAGRFATGSCSLAAAAALVLLAVIILVLLALGSLLLVGLAAELAAQRNGEMPDRLRQSAIAVLAGRCLPINRADSRARDATSVCWKEGIINRIRSLTECAAQRLEMLQALQTSDRTRSLSDQALL